MKELKERNQRITTELLRMLNSIQNITLENVDDNLSKINDLLAEAVSVRIQNDQLKNITVQEPIPVFDSFAVITIVLAAIVGGSSFYFYKRSKKEFVRTLELLES